MLRLEPAALRTSFAGRRVLLTGHTGFKGGWLTHWLASLGAEVTGYALPPPTQPSFFEVTGVGQTCHHVLGDVRDLEQLRAVVRGTQPEVVFHLAAQPLVRLSYKLPLETFETNVMGTARLLEAVRLERARCVVVVVTSDKCYANREWAFGYREDDPLGGRDPYSASKGASEIVAASYRESFFPTARVAEHGVRLGTARAGNVIGGGDWALDRIVPDAIRALAAGRPIDVRNPGAIRPWQHVLEPLGGYLLLAMRMMGCAETEAQVLCDAWNFGPSPGQACSVGELSSALVAAWGGGRWAHAAQPQAPHEARYLRLSIEKSCGLLAWAPRWDVETAVRRTVAWYRAQVGGAAPDELRALTLSQIDEYLATGPST